MYTDTEHNTEPYWWANSVNMQIKRATGDLIITLSRNMTESQ